MSTANHASSSDARALVDQLLDEAVRQRASDIHLEPTREGVEVRFRIDGMLQPVQTLEVNAGRSAVSRLMVLAHLLTYRLDVPQEGRATVNLPSLARPVDLRLSIMPTTHGLRAAIRLPAELIQPHQLDQLDLPAEVARGLESFAGSDSGMLLVTGPAGSGKTTTIYALLEHIARTSPGISIVALEDPVERDLPGVTQIEVSPFGELTYERTLRSILRQDPQVLMLGEIRDSATAALGVQAALSGHRLISTLHAGTPAGAIARLLEMGIEPYQLSSALFGIISQRLVRRLEQDHPATRRYSGRFPLAEWVVLDEAMRSAILARSDAAGLMEIYRRQPGFRPMRDLAGDCIRSGVTDESEARRVLGGDAPAPQK